MSMVRRVNAKVIIEKARITFQKYETTFFIKFMMLSSYPIDLPMSRQTLTRLAGRYS